MLIKRVGIYGFFLMMVVVIAGLINRLSHTEEELVVGTNLWSGYEILYLAREKGFIDKEKIRLVEYNTTSEVLRGLTTGVINAGALTLDEAIKAYDRGLNVQVVMVFDYSDGADVIIVKDYIDSPADLKGKKIGVERSALGNYLLKRFLEINNLKEEDIKIVYLELHEHTRSFLNGDIDAVITFEPEKSKILSKEGKVIFSSKDIPMEIVDVLVVDKNYLNENIGTVKHLIEAYYQAYDYFVKNREESLNVMSKRQHLSKEELATAFKNISFPSRRQVVENIERLEEATKNICEFLKNNGEIKSSTKCDAILNIETLKGSN